MLAYEFVIQVSLPVEEVRERLEKWTRSSRPTGFWLRDPRMAGTFNGPLFTLASHEQTWLPILPEAEGQIVPAPPHGSRVAVRVTNSAWMLGSALVALPIIIFAAFVAGLPLLDFLFFGGLEVLLLFALPRVEGSRIRRLIVQALEVDD